MVIPKVENLSVNMVNNTLPQRQRNLNLEKNIEDITQIKSIRVLSHLVHYIMI